MASALVVFPASARTRGAASETRRMLFDGKSLAGWRGDAARWNVRDRVIVGRAGEAGDSFLLSNRSYGSFRLTFSARVDEGGQGGLCFWGGRPRGAAPGCLSFTFPTPGARDRASDKNLTWKSVHPAPARKADGWLDVEVLADARTGRVRMAYDGIEVLDYVHPDPGQIERGALAFHVAAAGGRTPEVKIKDVLVDVAPQASVLVTVNLCGSQGRARP